MASLGFCIGSSSWPGLSKLIEEAAEAMQVAGKLIGAEGQTKHWDGSDLAERIHEELVDLIAACRFVIQANGLDAQRIEERSDEKLERFWKWHRQVDRG